MQPTRCVSRSRLGLSARLLGTVFCLLCIRDVSPALAQPPFDTRGWIPTVWTTADGLPQNTVNDIIESPDGELWLATYGGLVHFDGLTFETLDMASLPDLPSIRLVRLSSDGRGGLWAGTQYGQMVHIVDRRVDQVVTLTDDAAAIGDVASGGPDRLWACAQNGEIWRRDHEWTRVPTVSGVLSTRVAPDGTVGRCPAPNAFVAAQDGSLWLATADGVARFSWEGKPLAHIPLSETATALALAPSGELWIGTTHGLYLSADTTTAVPVVVPSMPVGSVEALAAGHESVDVASEGGVARLVRATNQWVVATAIPRTSGGDRATVLRRDQRGNTWVGLHGGGLKRLRRKPVWTFGSHGVAAITDGPAGAVTVAMGCHDLYQATLDGLTPLGSKPSPCIRTAWRDRRGVLWLGTTEGLLRDGTAEPLPPAARIRRPVTRLVEDAAGLMWVAFDGGRLLALDQGRVARDITLPSGSVRSLAFDQRGMVWIGTDDALFRISGSSWRRWDAARGLPRGPVRALLPRPDGSLWIATYGGGLGLMRDGRIANVPGLPDNGLSGLIEDDRHRLWVLSNRGLLVAGAAHLADVAEGRTRSLDLVVLGTEAGIPEGTFGAPAVWSDHGGRFWFATIQTVVVIDPRALPFSVETAVPRIVAVHADNDARPPVSGLILPPSPSRVTISFTSSALTAPTRTLFRWRLDGIDEDWSEPSPRRTVSYTRLAPGPYRLRVLARNEDGVWATGEAVLDFVIAPSWHQTWWARSGAALLVALTLVVTHATRTRGIRRHGRALALEVDERARAQEQVARLRVQLEHVSRVTTAGELATSLAHELNQPLAAITTNAQAARRYLAHPEPPLPLVTQILGDVVQQSQRASDVIQTLRAFLRKAPSTRITMPLNDIVHEVLPLMQVEMDAHAVAFTIELAPDLPAVRVDRIQIQQVIINLVNNAREASEQSPGQHQVWVRTRLAGSRVRLECQDNGPGLAAAVADQVFEPFVTTKPNGMGMGLAICRSLVEINDGCLTYEVPDTGVTFVVEFPPAPLETA